MKGGNTESGRATIYRTASRLIFSHHSRLGIKYFGKFLCSNPVSAKNLQNFVSPKMAEMPEGSGSVAGTDEDDLHEED